GPGRRRAPPAAGERDVDVAPAAGAEPSRVVQAGRDRREVVDAVLVTVSVAVATPAAVAVGVRRARRDTDQGDDEHRRREACGQEPGSAHNTPPTAGRPGLAG